jgi:hypothetical protein
MFERNIIASIFCVEDKAMKDTSMKISQLAACFIGLLLNVLVQIVNKLG